MKLAVSGCARNCAQATVKDMGAVAIPDGWQIFIGGAPGLRVRAGDLLATIATHDDVLRLIGRFIQYYRENARYAERSPAFVERIGIERLRAHLLNESSEEVKRLDREIQRAAAIDPAYVVAMMAGVTQHLGLGVTRSVTYFSPYDIARTFATLDHLSNDRAAWNVVTSVVVPELQRRGVFRRE